MKASAYARRTFRSARNKIEVRQDEDIFENQLYYYDKIEDIQIKQVDYMKETYVNKEEFAMLHKRTEGMQKENRQRGKRRRPRLRAGPSAGKCGNS